MNRFRLVFEPRREEARERVPVHSSLRAAKYTSASPGVCACVHRSQGDGGEERVRLLPHAGSESARPEKSFHFHGSVKAAILKEIQNAKQRAFPTAGTFKHRAQRQRTRQEAGGENPRTAANPSVNCTQRQRRHALVRFAFTRGTGGRPRPRRSPQFHWFLFVLLLLWHPSSVAFTLLRGTSRREFRLKSDTVGAATGVPRRIACAVISI